MEIGFENRGEMLTVSLKGELDQHSAAAFRKTIDDRVLSESRINTLMLDLKGVGFMDSSGIGLILGRYKLMRNRGGKLLVSNASKSVEKLLKLSGVYSLLESGNRRKHNG